MYESFFGLARRPFLATPDPDCFAAHASIENALAGLRLCVDAGQGFGILSAPAGMGKTLLCRKLIVDLRDRFATVFLAHSNFPTRRALLQAILYELGHPYIRMAEQELRLELKTAVTGLPLERSGVLLVVDEAHQLNHGLLEEIRTTANLDRDGTPLFRVLLSGQLSLEEKLAGPELEALNQRIACQVTLEPLTRAESADYVAHRLGWAGADVGDIFQPEALEIVCHAADGVPRCLNQLCDHSLMLSYVAGQRPVDGAIVREALEDLKQLPLHWNEPPPVSHSPDQLQQQTADGGESGEAEYDQHAEATDVSVTETGGEAIEVGAVEVGAIEVGAIEVGATEGGRETSLGIDERTTLETAGVSESAAGGPTPAARPDAGVVETEPTSSVETPFSVETAFAATDDERQHPTADDPQVAVVEVGGDGPASMPCPAAEEHSALSTAAAPTEAKTALAAERPRQQDETHAGDDETHAGDTAFSPDAQPWCDPAASTIGVPVASSEDAAEYDADGYEEEFVIDRYAMLDAGRLPSRPQRAAKSDSGTGEHPATSAATASRSSESLPGHGIDLTTDDFGHVSAVARTPDQLIDAIQPIVSDALNDCPASEATDEAFSAATSEGIATPAGMDAQFRPPWLSSDEAGQGGRGLSDVGDPLMGDVRRPAKPISDDSTSPADVSSAADDEQRGGFQVEPDSQSPAPRHEVSERDAYDVVQPERSESTSAVAGRTDSEVCLTEGGAKLDESSAGPAPRGRYAHLFSQLRRRQRQA